MPTRKKPSVRKKPKQPSTRKKANKAKTHKPRKPPKAAHGMRPRRPMAHHGHTRMPFPVSATLKFSSAANVTVDIDSLDPNVSAVSVVWNGTTLFEAAKATDPRLHAIDGTYVEGSTDNRLAVTFTTPPATGSFVLTRSKAAIKAIKSSKLQHHDLH